MQTVLSTPRGTVELRAARESDAERYRELRLEALRDNSQAFITDHAAAQAEPAEKWLERIRESDGQHDAILYFAVAGGDLIGMAGVGRGSRAKTRHSGMVWGVYVRPEWRALGIGRALVMACLEWARRAGLSIVKLGAMASNPVAIACYAHLGFVEYGVEPQAIRWDGVYYDEVLMAIEL